MYMHFTPTGRGGETDFSVWHKLYSLNKRYGYRPAVDGGREAR